MAPSIFHQPGWRGDREVVVSTKLEAEPLVGEPHEKNPYNANTKANGDGAMYGTGASDAQRTSRNFFAGIADFFGGLGDRKSQALDNSGNHGDTTTSSTPVVSSAHENPGGTSATTEVLDDDGSVLPGCRHKGGEPEVVVMALRSAESGAIRLPASPPVAISGAASREGGPWQATAANGASAESGNWGWQGRGADDYGEMEEVKENLREVQEGNGVLDARHRMMCDQARGMSFVEEEFVPCYATFTPNMSSDSLQEMKYRAPETRVPSAVAPPSSVARPNYHDALKRVAVVVYHHMKTCEWRRQAAEAREKALAAAAAARGPDAMKSWRRSAPALHVLRGDENALWADAGSRGARRRGEVIGSPEAKGSSSSVSSEPFNSAQADKFDEKHFVSPKYRYKFIPPPVMALPGAMFTLKEIKAIPTTPTVDEIYEFIKTLFNKACLSSECSLVCLIYVERLMETAHVPLLAGTWKPILLCGLLLASKVWQDLSSWNVEFSTVYPEYSLKSINRLELLFLGAMRWDMSISSSLYAKYYFALRSLAEKKDFRRRYNQVMQIDAPRANRVQQRADAVRKDVAKTTCILSKSL